MVTLPYVQGVTVQYILKQHGIASAVKPQINVRKILEQ